MADPNADKTGGNQVDGNNAAQPYLGTWATKEAAEEGLASLQSTLDRQGNEVGGLRKQVELANQMISNQPQQPATPAAKQEQTKPNYSKDITAIQKEMADLVPEDETYQTDLMALMNKSNNLAALEQHDKTLNAATKMFREELDERDTKATHQAFYDKNPEFNTPEMQAQIRERIAADRTGMTDSVSAYREIQRDTAMQQATALEEENTELKRIAGLAKGTDATGKVITKGQSPQQTAQHVKTTGADRDKGMQEALNAMR